MKEELIRVLNAKLDDINTNINSLVELNGKIEKEKEKLSYVDSVLELFKDEKGYEIYHFSKVNKENFEKSISLLDEKIKNKFSTNSCNYDGLVYLINGINTGVSLTLTEEQSGAILDYIQGLHDKEQEHEAVIDGLMLVKMRYPISDLDVLNAKKNDYTNIISKANNDEYIAEIDDINEAIEFSQLDVEKVVSILKYLLKYNADIHATKKEAFKEVNDFNTKVDFEPLEEKNDFRIPEFDKIDFSNPLNTMETPKTDEIVFPKIEEEQKTVTFEEPKIEDTPLKEEMPVDVVLPTDTQVIPEEKEMTYEAPIGNNFEEYHATNDETISMSPVQLEEQEEGISTRELQRMFTEHNLKVDNDILNELLIGNIDNYQKNLDILKQNNVLEEFIKNRELFIETLLYTKPASLDEVLGMIRRDLSVDDEDYYVTLGIAIRTIPTIFVEENGNLDNFVKNTKLYKDLGINLINLFDFSREMFVANNANIMINYNIVKNYNVSLDYRNIKYLLLLPNIGEKLDYYVESVYADRTKNNEKFDGINYINNYPNKLNTVCDETIKRLRYSSENAKKVFGSKPNSLAGEITNLKVDVLDIGDGYRNMFFNNEFDMLTQDEVREYTRLVRNSSNVGNFTDELSILEKYHNGLRYVINNINISYNKVVRNYNTLRSYGVSKASALVFAVCYNAVITKDEYQGIAKVLDELGEDE